jgi:FkbM family methyltransferase
VDDKALLSLVLMLKDEARSAERVVRAAAPHVDRVDLLLDAASADATADIVRRVCAELGLPLGVTTAAFVDFATNRNLSLEAAAPFAVFGIQVSGDEYLHHGESLRAFCAARRGASGPGEGAYYVDVRYDSLGTLSQRLVRLDAGWRWVGAVHEVMAKTGDATVHVVPGAYLLHTGSDPERKRLRFYKDLELLREQVLKDPADARATFYLAQTLESLGMPGEAAAMYLRRAELKGWPEEVFVAKYRAAHWAERAGRPWAEVEALYLDAYAYRPSRAEPLVALAAHYHTAHQYAAAYLFASRAAALPLPADSLFVDRNAYDWQATNYVSLCAFYAGAYAEGEAATRRMVERWPNSPYPRKNLEMYRQKTGAAAPPPPRPEEAARVGEVEISLRPDSYDRFVLDEVVRDDAYGLRTMDLPARPVVVDLGAHVGIFAAAVLAERPAARVVCAELDAANYDRLKKHLGGRDLVKLAHVAVVGAKVPTGYRTWPANLGAHALAWDGRGDVRPVDRTATLRELLAQHGVTRVDLLKVDIEGAEYEVLREAARDGALARCARVVGEWHEVGTGSRGELREIFGDAFELRVRGADRAGTFAAVRRPVARADASAA